MTKYEYQKKMIWAIFWMKVWKYLQVIGIYPSIKTRWFGWIVSQTGFLYMPKFEDL